MKKQKLTFVCKCGNYKPISLKGVILSVCINCGGTKPIIKYGN